MKRAQISTILISFCICHLWCVNQAATVWFSQSPQISNTNNNVNNSNSNIIHDKPTTALSIDKNALEARDSYYHPAVVEKPRLIERFDKRYSDGHYEYRYVLSNGDTRYEQSYWQNLGKTAVLARRGYYSYPTPDHKFQTVFYTIDNKGFQENLSTFSNKQPDLPYALNIPEDAPTTASIKPHNQITTTHKPKPKPKPTALVNKPNFSGNYGQKQKHHKQQKQQPMLYNKNGEKLEISIKDLSRVRKNVKIQKSIANQEENKHKQMRGKQTIILNQTTEPHMKTTSTSMEKSNDKSVENYAETISIEQSTETSQ